MKNPTVEQVNFVIKKLQLVRDDAIKEGAFNMNVWRVYDDHHECGTVHCVGGWYAVANWRRQAIKDKFNKGRVTYEHGADLMAKDLGFFDRDCLVGWANDNPKIWGNKYGFEMFTGKLAYSNKGFEGVIAQWELVKQNLIELEQ